jgi:NifU-like protein involved in Fe-S cluster formation
MEVLDYSKMVMDRFERPINAGRLHGRDVTGAAGDESLGTRVEFDFRVRQGVVEKGTFRAYGCPHAIAAASWAAEAAEGRRLSNTGWFNALELAKMLAVPDYKLGVLLVVEDALRDAAGVHRDGRGGTVSRLPEN